MTFREPRMTPTQKANELAYRKEKNGLPLTPDQYEKLMRSAALADEAGGRKKEAREAGKYGG